MIKHNPSEMSMKPMKAFKVNFELSKIAGNQYFSSSHNILTYECQNQ